MFHKSNLGAFGDRLPCDLNGRVPEVGDDPHDFTWEHDEFTEDHDEQGNGYHGYAMDQWGDFVDQAMAATTEAEAALAAWRGQGS